MHRVGFELRSSETASHSAIVLSPPTGDALSFFQKNRINFFIFIIILENNTIFIQYLDLHHQIQISGYYCLLS